MWDARAKGEDVKAASTFEDLDSTRITHAVGPFYGYVRQKRVFKDARCKFAAAS